MVSEPWLVKLPEIMKFLIRISSFLYSGIIVVLFTSCSALYYAPNPQNVPLFTEKNEYRVAGSITLSEYTGGLNLSGAYSFADHFGFTGNIFLVGEADDLIPNRRINKGNLADVGLIYFLPFGSLFVFESTAGFGGGKAINEGDYGSGTVKFRNYYLQPSIGIASEHFDIALSAKYSILSYYSVEVSATNTDGGAPIDKPYSLIEPALTFRFGWEHFKIQTQFVRSINLSSAPLSQDYVNLNFGIYFVLTDKYSR